MAETNTMDVIFVDYLLPGEPEDAEKHRVPLEEFLALSPEQLTEQNQKIQKALGQLYQLNDREPPLFNSFPKRKTELVINCTPIEGNVSACYFPNANRVDIVEGTLKNTESALLQTFAHELKHAEQSSEELCKMEYDARHNNGLAYHQLEYLIEAQAFAFGSYVTYLFQLESSSPQTQWRFDEAVFPILEKHTKGKSIDDFYDIQCEIMKKVLPIIYEDELYRDQYDLDSPILRKDKGLTEEEIPASFHFKDPKEAFSLLKDMPREARTPAEKIRSMIRYIYKWDKSLFHNKLISSGEILDIIKTEFARSPKDATRRHVRYSKDMLEAFLDFKVDEKPFMQEEFITKLFKNARISGRKDVEEAILAYKAEHPEDKRFSEKMFEFNRRDKVAEFVKRQERKAAEVEAAAKNAAKKAANKGVSAVTAAVKAAKSK